MSGSKSVSSRFDAIKVINERTPRKFDPPRDENGARLRVSEFFGMNTFSTKAMKDKLPSAIFAKLNETIEQGKPLDSEIAKPVAEAIKEWALERGVTHFCHWFQPQTGLTAEKHDAFLDFDENSNPIEKFSGSQLIQSEPDASSFPSGGMRTTFEARGYTAWDSSSPVFIMDTPSSKTLCIPSVFISYHGDALDEKTGLLRSMEVLSQKTCELLQTMGMTGVNRVVPTLGLEQEYFLIDRAFYSLRPDLIMAGRTLLGGQPPKGQQLEDHYFGSIPARVQALMAESEYELYKLGVPVKTRHNEVAPNQFEMAPIFEEANVATDHNQLVMEVLRKVALRHNFAMMLHEKPFAGVNGSGKHNNWSMMVISDDSEVNGLNLLDPGKTPHQNLRFLLVMSGVMKAVFKHSGMLRAGIASSGNDHRLGANEAPPAIISVFLGGLLTKICDELEKGLGFDQNPERALINLGVSKLPEVAKDNTDRNRTSPFAFTGNKFEFRAVGSSASPAFPITLLNAAVADVFSDMSGKLKAKIDGGKAVDAAVLELVSELLREAKAIRFDGNGYSEEWVREAERRGLPNLRKTPEALREILSKQTKEVLSKFGIFNEAEIESRYHVRVERYLKNLGIEVDTLRQLVDTVVLPACFAYHGSLSLSVANAKAAGVPAPQTASLTKIGALLMSLQEKRTVLDAELKKAEALQSEEAKATAFAVGVAQAMLDVRETCDQLESMVADDYWPLPKYREMLFLS